MERLGFRLFPSAQYFRVLHPLLSGDNHLSARSVHAASRRASPRLLLPLKRYGGGRSSPSPAPALGGQPPGGLDWRFSPLADFACFFDLTAAFAMYLEMVRRLATTDVIRCG